MSAPRRGRGAKPSPAVAPQTPASSHLDSAPGGSGEPKSSPERNTTEAPTSEQFIPIPSDPTEEDRDGGVDAGVEAESGPQ